MHGRLQEDMAWLRLQDMQRELENRRLMRTGGEPLGVRLIRFAGGRLARLGGAALRRTAARDAA